MRDDPLNARDPYGTWTIQIGGNGQAALPVGGGYSAGIYFGTRRDGSFDIGVFQTVKVAAGDQLGAEVVIEVGVDLGSNRVNTEDLAGTNVIAEVDALVGVSLEAPADGRADVDPGVSRVIANVSGGPSAGAAVGVNSTQTFGLHDALAAIADSIFPGPEKSEKVR